MLPPVAPAQRADDAKEREDRARGADIEHVLHGLAFHQRQHERRGKQRAAEIEREHSRGADLPLQVAADEREHQHVQSEMNFAIMQEGRRHEPPELSSLQNERRPHRAERYQRVQILRSSERDFENEHRRVERDQREGDAREPPASGPARALGHDARRDAFDNGARLRRERRGRRPFLRKLAPGGDPRGGALRRRGKPLECAPRGLCLAGVAMRDGDPIGARVRLQTQTLCRKALDLPRLAGEGENKEPGERGLFDRQPLFHLLIGARQLLDAPEFAERAQPIGAEETRGARRLRECEQRGPVAAIGKQPRLDHLRLPRRRALCDFGDGAGAGLRVRQRRRLRQRGGKAHRRGGVKECGEPRVSRRGVGAPQARHARLQPPENHWGRDEGREDERDRVSRDVRNELERRGADKQHERIDK